MWSLGVTFYELISGKTPFDAKTHPAVVLKIIKGEYEKNLDEKKYNKEFINTIYSLLNQDPHKRPSAAEILEMDFIKKRATKYLEETIGFLVATPNVPKDQRQYTQYLDNTIFIEEIENDYVKND